MGKQKELPAAAFQILAPATKEEVQASIPDKVEFAVIQHNYLGEFFIDPFGDRNKSDDFLGQIVHIHRGARRDFESQYSESDPKPPTCFSVDGVNGSIEEQVRLFSVGENPPRKYRTYGACNTCLFKEFGTRGLWQAGNTGAPGIQCSEYTLVFLFYAMKFDDDSVSEFVGPCVLQIPPTSVKVFDYKLTDSIRKISGASAHNIWWRFHGTGGKTPRQKGEAKAINLTPAIPATPEQVLAAKEAHEDNQELIDKFIVNFASGGITGGSSAVDEDEQEVSDLDSVTI